MTCRGEGRSGLDRCSTSSSFVTAASATACSRPRARSASGCFSASRWRRASRSPSGCIALAVWLWRASDRLTALSLGLIIGGAIGNAIDRFAYGWVFDFVYFHVRTSGFRFDWYVFNLADVAIVAGVAGLLYENLFGDRAAKAP